MNMVKISKNVAVSLYIGMMFLMVLIAFMLFSQYRYFKQETKELVQVKESYYQHVEMLKRSLNASLVQVPEESEEQEDKKKNELADEKKFEGEVFIQSVHPIQPQFELINAKEESQLHAVKNSFVKKFKKASALKRKRLVQKVVKSIVKNSGRYGPQREFAFDWPIELSKFWLSSLFGPRKLASGKISFHYAIDMASLKGTPVKASAAGKIILAQLTNSGYGNCVMIEHNSRYKTRYAHLDAILVKPGQNVSKGQNIGTVGDSGYVRKYGKDASHLHFEIYQDGQRVNPLKFLFS